MFNSKFSSSQTDPALDKAAKLRNRGNDLFKLGYYREAEGSYSQALTMLPPTHHLTALISNNRAAALLKIQQHRRCVMDCAVVIDWARAQIEIPATQTTKLVFDGEEVNIRWRDQLVKALTRKAEALEAMARLAEASQAYQELATLEPSNTKATEGLARCKKNLNKPTPTPPPRPGTSATSMFTNNSTTAFPGLDYSIFEQQQKEQEPPKSEAVRAMRERQAKLAKDDQERLLKQDMVNARIDTWKRGKEKNIRALLATVDVLLWPGANWKSVSAHEIMEPKKIKVCYMRAIAKVHPDKLASDASVEHRLLANGIFTVLNQAWDDFRSNNTI
ncbi:TPR-like protein [Hesseltinella vesiculosa]|uniref:TPR-like protein n=1 Tax=Hesseltinella vesiculosa TaxID=101127 RepID=A0A1X2GVU6_9FUNG|nr:TPR-like protein [Hesseltinella vesiculosa]